MKTLSLSLKFALKCRIRTKFCGKAEMMNFLTRAERDGGGGD